MSPYQKHTNSERMRALNYLIEGHALFLDDSLNGICRQLAHQVL